MYFHIHWKMLNAALRLFVFHMHKSNKIYILVRELEHLLPLSCLIIFHSFN